MAKTLLKTRTEKIQEALKLPGQVRVRIAPAPTGLLHIGTARTFLFNWLFARKFGGVFVVRIEDTDIERSRPEFEEDIRESLKWLGLKWNEGPDIGGPYGPYRQSERTEIYSKYIQKLLEQNKAYFCYCTEEELKAQQNDQIARGEPPRYSGKCRNLSDAEQKKYIREGRKPVIRFKMPTKKIIFDDVVRGKIEFEGDLIGDVAIAKDVKTPLYNLAVVIDDYEMKITHIIRGEDHISNTPKQIALEEALGFEQPHWAHLPLILGSDRTKLSKRHGATSISEYRQEGYLPEALVNFMALLGWNPDTEQEIFTYEELIRNFDFGKVQKSGAVFNIAKLNWINAQHLRQKSAPELTNLSWPFFEGLKIKIDKEKLPKIVELQKERAKTLKELAEISKFFFELEDYPTAMLIWKDLKREALLKNLKIIREKLIGLEDQEFDLENLKSTIEALAQKEGTGEIYWPLRVALSGLSGSPSPLEIAEILGKNETLRRIDLAIKKISTA